MKNEAPTKTTKKSTGEKGYETVCLYISRTITESITPNHKPSAANIFSKNIIIQNKLNRKSEVRPNGEILNESKSNVNISINRKTPTFFFVKKRITENKKTNGKDIIVDSKNKRAKKIGIDSKTAFIEII